MLVGQFVMSMCFGRFVFWLVSCVAFSCIHLYLCKHCLGTTQLCSLTQLWGLSHVGGACGCHAASVLDVYHCQGHSLC